MNCKLIGYEYKSLEVTLSPGESFYAERGSIVYVDEMLQHDVEFNSGGNPLRRLGGALRTAFSGESVLIIHFYNATCNDRKMVLSGSMCSLVAIKMQCASGNLLCRRGFYVGSTNKMNISLNVNLQGLLGGTRVFQKISGEATVFLDSVGVPIEKALAQGETISVDEDHIVALHGFRSWQIQAGWSFGNMLQGEGVSLMSITGPGKIYLSPISLKMHQTLNSRS